MTTAAFIPIKSRSERVPGKNFKLFDGVPLFHHIIDHAIAAAVFDVVYVDTDSDTVAEYASGHGCRVIPRREDLASNDANGNHLLAHHYSIYPNYAYYFQLFATAPRLTPQTIARCVCRLTDSNDHDSIFTATDEPGWWWLNGLPVNYRPGMLPRSQDAPTLTKETTGLYGIKAKALEHYGQRIGERPIVHVVDDSEAVDLDTFEDFIRSQSPE